MKLEELRIVGTRIPNLDPPITTHRGHMVLPDLGFNLGSTLVRSILRVFELHTMVADLLEELASNVANIVMWIFHANMEFNCDIFNINLFINSKLWISYYLK